MLFQMVLFPRSKAALFACKELLVVVSLKHSLCYENHEIAAVSGRQSSAYRLAHCFFCGLVCPHATVVNFSRAIIFNERPNYAGGITIFNSSKFKKRHFGSLKNGLKGPLNVVGRSVSRQDRTNLFVRVQVIASSTTIATLLAHEWLFLVVNLNFVVSKMLCTVFRSLR